MPSKEEYIKEHGVSERAFLIYCINALVDDDIRINGDNINDLKGFLYELVDEHFKLKEKYSKILDDVHDYRFETHCMKMTVRNLCEHFGVKNEKELQNIYLNKPYKFEDLKPGMWVFDCVKNRVNKIIVTFVYGCPYIKLDDGFGEWFIVGYEENRFFSMQMANVINIKKENKENNESNN